mmetsp:Transcript_12415/g.31747  ORF Transcript_12415/g.31747 Transcript_12415/m.31747 type:complete len:462 (-) Transcript_12415:1232-2617(-)|eukprot:jgi/Tetstr1/427665/TSEL_017790.t1
MIIYSKAFWGIPALLGRWYGSPFPRVLPFAAASCGWSVFLFFFRESLEWPSAWGHPYPFQAFAYIVGFALIFRCNSAYARYWEGRTHVQIMTSKWSEMAAQMQQFDRIHLREGEREAHETFMLRLMHLVSLMHALALQHLRRDFNLSNLRQFNASSRPPPVDAARLKERARRTLKEAEQKASEALGDVEMSEHHRAVEAYLGCGGCMGNFLMMWTSKSDQYNHLCPLSVIGGLYQVERDALQTDTPEQTMSGCLHVVKDEYAPVSYERVNVVHSWLLELVSHRQMEGGLRIAPPILSRAYQLLSDGMSAYDQCRKIAYHPFPFPWAQMLLVFLIFYSACQPLMLVAFIKSLWLVILLNLLSVGTYWTINEVARDLEDPFILDPNDFPHQLYQYAFNQRIQLECHAVSCPVLHLDEVRKSGEVPLTVTHESAALESIITQLEHAHSMEQAANGEPRNMTPLL